MFMLIAKLNNIHRYLLVLMFYIRQNDPYVLGNFLLQKFQVFSNLLLLHREWQINKVQIPQSTFKSSSIKNSQVY